MRSHVNGFPTSEVATLGRFGVAITLVLLTTLACGGNTSRRQDDLGASSGSGGAAGSSGGTGGASPRATPVADLRFDRITVGNGRFCGITRGDRRLVCVAGDRVEDEREGPYRDISMNEDSGSWSYTCGVLANGELDCIGFDLLLPEGPFEEVSVGFFNACAWGREGARCWFDVPGATPSPEIAGPRFTVDQDAYCFQPSELHAECFDARGTRLLPTHAHFVDIVAAPKSGCAALIGAPRDAIPSETEPELAELLSASGIACFSANGFEAKLPGLFVSLDVDVDRNGCAIRAEDGGVECWGAHADGVPTDDVPAVQVSVSTSLGCALWEDGRVSCW